MEKRIKNSAKKDPVDSIPNIDTSWKNSLGFQLGKALWALSATLNATLKENGIDLPTSQYIVMRFLYGQDGISQNRIATLLYKDAAAIKRSIDNLEKKGLVERRAVSRCKNNIYLTEKGRELMPEVIAVANKVFDMTTELPEDMCRIGNLYLESIYNKFQKEKNAKEKK